MINVNSSKMLPEKDDGKMIKILDDDDDPNIGAELNSQSEKDSDNYSEDPEMIEE